MSNIYFMLIIFLGITIVLATLLSFFFSIKMSRLKNYINELKKENEKLLTNYTKNKNNPLGNLFSPNSKSVSISIDKSGKIIQANDNLLDLLGYTKKQLIGKNIYGTLMPTPSKKEPLELNTINRLFNNPKLYTEHETEFKTKSGQKIWFSWTNRILFDKSKKPYEVHSVGFDITKRKNMEEQLQFLATIDPQTGVLNRHSLLEIGTRELKRSLRHKHEFSALVFRLTIPENQTLTESEKDDILHKFITVFKTTARDTDYLGRIDEDEFVLLLPETPEQNVPALIGRLTSKLEDYNKKHSSYLIQVSFGYAGYEDKMKSVDTLITTAISRIAAEKRK